VRVEMADRWRFIAAQVPSAAGSLTSLWASPVPAKKRGVKSSGRVAPSRLRRSHSTTWIREFSGLQSPSPARIRHMRLGRRKDVRNDRAGPRTVQATEQIEALAEDEVDRAIRFGEKAQQFRRGGGPRQANGGYSRLHLQRLA
jgi:hypothetical protein